MKNVREKTKCAFEFENKRLDFSVDLVGMAEPDTNLLVLVA